MISCDRCNTALRSPLAYASCDISCAEMSRQAYLSVIWNFCPWSMLASSCKTRPNGGPSSVERLGPTTADDVTRSYKSRRPFSRHTHTISLVQLLFQRLVLPRCRSKSTAIAYPASCSDSWPCIETQICICFDNAWIQCHAVCRMLLPFPAIAIWTTGQSH